MDTLQRKVNIGHILSRVHGEAQKLLLDDKDDTFLKRFELNKRRPAYVVAIDLRRSTELMLKAESPESFAKFITELCNRLWDIIINNFGIFEKFTGDGILSFFPEFYSGDNSGIFAVKAALKCHESFVDLYKKYYSSFIAVLSDVGLGIGIDFGEITMVNLQNTLSIVGVPVVYACRLSGGKRGQTLLNQPAYKAILEKGCSCFNLCETVIEVKHEGPLVAYDVTSNGSEIPEVKPEWLAKVQNSDSNKK
jgi:class 3 adenylate cyclase